MRRLALAALITTFAIGSAFAQSCAVIVVTKVKTARSVMIRFIPISVYNPTRRFGKAPGPIGTL